MLNQDIKVEGLQASERIIKRLFQENFSRLKSDETYLKLLYFTFGCWVLEQ